MKVKLHGRIVRGARSTEKKQTYSSTSARQMRENETEHAQGVCGVIRRPQGNVWVSLKELTLINRPH